MESLKHEKYRAIVQFLIPEWLKKNHDAISLFDL